MSKAEKNRRKRQRQHELKKELEFSKTKQNLLTADTSKNDSTEKHRTSKEKTTLGKASISNKEVSESKDSVKIVSKVTYYFLCFWSVFSAIALIFGFLSDYNTLFPYPAISPAKTSETTQPLSVPFSILNKGFFTLYDVKFECEMNKTEDIYNNGMDKVSFGSANPVVHKIAYNESFPQSCRIGLDPNQLLSADITINVTYHYRWSNSEIPVRARFITYRGDNNQLYWLQRPLED